MPVPYIDPALGVLRSQLRAKYPGVVIYWIGDPAHQGRPSDHNPEADGSVDAIDVMVGPHFSESQADELVNTLVHFHDWRISYIIWKRRIWKYSTGWKTYNGSDPHTNHIHISRNDVQENNTNPWSLVIPRRVVKVFEFTVKMPEYKQGDNDDDFPGYNMIARIQKLCGFTGKDVDGDWGPKTTEGIERTADVPNGSKMTEDIYRRLFGLTR